MNFGVAIVMAYRYKHPGHANDNYSQYSLDRDEGGEIEISSANSIPRMAWPELVLDFRI